MENNTIQPDEMDRLLRETFLESDFPETEAVTDLMAKQAFHTPWVAVPPLAKEAALMGKKGFFAGFSLNALIGTVLVTGMGIAGGTYVLMDHAGNASSSDVGLGTVSPVQALPARIPHVEVTETPVPQPGTVATYTYRAKPKNQPASQNNAGMPTTSTADSSANPRSMAGNGKTAPGKPRQNRYILVPSLTPEDIYENEKRKKNMVRQVVNEDKKEWAYIPMGTTHINGEAVSVQSFYMQKHEVTNLQYKTYLYDLIIKNRLQEYQRAAIHDSAWLSYQGLEALVQTYFWHPVYNDYPVVNVSPEGALLYTIWLTNEVNNTVGDKTKINDIRLPTVEEWIYAARADNDSAIYAWKGPYLRSARGNLLANYRSEMNEDGTDITAPVTAYPPNDWGLYNMCGNVAELTRPNDPGTVVVKGGAWNQPAEYLKLLHENRIPVNKLPLPTVGFRAVYTYMGTR